MKNELLSTQDAAAYAAKLCNVDIVPNFPSPFANEIVEKLRQIHRCEIFDIESQNSAILAALSSEACEKRTFLPLSAIRTIEEFYITSFMRLPIVGVNISRPIDNYSLIYNHNDILALRDAGWLIFMPESVQEVIDTIIHAYRICEDSKVLLPAMINIDMIIRETVQIPTEQFVKNFLPKLKLPHKIDVKNPKIFGVPVENYEEFKLQQHLAMKNALNLMPKIYEKWKKLKRNYNIIEKYMLDDAEYAIVITGFNSTTAKSAINKMRELGKKVGLLRLRVLRPWPKDEISKALKDIKKVAVLDHAISLGYGGILYLDMKSCYNGFISNFISLGKHLIDDDFIKIISRIEKSEKEEIVWI
ncbi:MAG: hypothetical protein QXD48_03215 [Candidatus Aenigmatarchaeota archaeon]